MHYLAVSIVLVAVATLSWQVPLTPSELDEKFLERFNRKYKTLKELDKNRCLQKLTCILARNQSSFEDPVIANIVRDFDTMKNIQASSPAFDFLVAYQKGQANKKCEKEYQECPIGFVADERELPEEEEDFAQEGVDPQEAAGNNTAIAYDVEELPVLADQ